MARLKALDQPQDHVPWDPLGLPIGNFVKCVGEQVEFDEVEFKEGAECEAVEFDVCKRDRFNFGHSLNDGVKASLNVMGVDIWSWAHRLRGFLYADQVWRVRKVGICHGMTPFMAMAVLGRIGVCPSSAVGRAECCAVLWAGWAVLSRLPGIDMIFRQFCSLRQYDVGVAHILRERDLSQDRQPLPRETRDGVTNAHVPYALTNSSVALTALFKLSASPWEKEVST